MAKRKPRQRNWRKLETPIVLIVLGGIAALVASGVQQVPGIVGHLFVVMVMGYFVFNYIDDGTTIDGIYMVGVVALGIYGIGATLGLWPWPA